MAYSRAPSLGLVMYLLKNSAADFFRFHQSHRQSLGKLQSLDQLPPEELKEVTMDLYTKSLYTQFFLEMLNCNVTIMHFIGPNMHRFEL